MPSATDRAEQLLNDMRRASCLVDKADNAQDYQMRLIALGMIARQYLRTIAVPEVA